ncbi:MAG: glycosyltransferase [Chloroflexi bacterium SZAS-1]|jgi:glycosyltransferase involved in cell wall biosynthesis|nr:glycosyltransferase [Chloroflexi bacterium SZAS-1]
MSAQPAVTVLMPVYNAAAYLAAALDSVLKQTFADFELLAIDDGSTDDSGALLASYAARDARLRVVPGERNLGLIARLNQGLELARGRYIARMDGDDLCLPTRLARQVALLDAQPNVALCGSWVQTFGDAATRIERYPSDDAGIRCELLFRNVLAHPATMLRRACIIRHALWYDPTFIHAEDYALWIQIANYGQIVNIPEVLVHYRIHAAQVGTRERAAQTAAAARVRLGQLHGLGLNPGTAEQAAHEAISAVQFQPSRAFVNAAEAWLQRILAANRTSKRYTETALLPVLGARWYTVCRFSTELGPWAWWRFQRSSFARHAPIDQRRRAKFLFKALARTATTS